MILAHTFLGEGSKSRAERLTAEIRRELRLPAFMSREKFDFTGNPGVGSKRLRYANEYQYEAYAVLVGEYDIFLEKGTAQFGEEHSLTLAALQNLAIVYQDKGRLAESESLKRKILSMPSVKRVIRS